MSSSQVLVVVVTDVFDEAPQCPRSGGWTVNVAEDTPVGAAFALLVARDSDRGDRLTYMPATAADSEKLTAIGISLRPNGTLAATALLDYESLSIMAISVVVTDAVGASTRCPLHMTVRDANEAPVAIHLSPGRVSETAVVGSAVAQLAVVDPDLGQNHTCALLPSGDAPAIFELSLSRATSQWSVVLASPLNYEDEGLHALFITCRDSGVPSKAISQQLFLSWLSSTRSSHPVSPLRRWKALSLSRRALHPVRRCSPS
jgi:hypothetical protein